jgi:hypothetical protein
MLCKDCKYKNSCPYSEENFNCDYGKCNGCGKDVLWFDLTESKMCCECLEKDNGL